MSLKDTIINDVKDAMRAKDQKKLSTLRLITAAIKQKEVDERIEVNDTALLIILDKLAKQRRESIAQFQAANRTDLVAQEEFELELIKSYLPKPFSDEEIIQLVNSTLATEQVINLADMGKIMNILKPVLQGRADMSLVSRLVKEKLS